MRKSTENILHDNPKVVKVKRIISEKLKEIINEYKEFSLDLYRDKRYTDSEAERFCLFMSLEKCDIKLLSHNKEYQDKILNNKYYKEYVKYNTMINNLTKIRHSL